MTKKRNTSDDQVLQKVTFDSFKPLILLKVTYRKTWKSRAFKCQWISLSIGPTWNIVTRTIHDTSTFFIIHLISREMVRKNERTRLHNISSPCSLICMREKKMNSLEPVAWEDYGIWKLLEWGNRVKWRKIIKKVKLEENCRFEVTEYAV